MLPLEEEVVFLRQCSDQFRLYAEILRNAGELQRRGGRTLADLATDRAADGTRGRGAGRPGDRRTRRTVDRPHRSGRRRRREQRLPRRVARRDRGRRAVDPRAGALVLRADAAVLVAGPRQAASGARCHRDRPAPGGRLAVRRVQPVRGGYSRSAQAAGLLPGRSDGRGKEPPRGKPVPASGRRLEDRRSRC